MAAQGTPLEWINAPVGRAHDPTDNAGGGELGIDLATPLNTPISSPWPGVVTYAGSSASTGGMVKVLTNIPGIGPIYEYFLHLNTGAVKAGQTIQAGQTLGFSGGTQPGAGGWPHVEYGLFTDPKYASQYWGFQTGSTLDPTSIIQALHNSGGVSPSSLPGAQGVANLINGFGVGSAAGSIAPSASNLFAGQLSQELGKVNTNLPNWLWQGGLILLGGLLILAGVIIFILPSRKEVEEAAGTVAGAAAKAP